MDYEQESEIFRNTLDVQIMYYALYNNINYDILHNPNIPIPFFIRASLQLVCKLGVTTYITAGSIIVSSPSHNISDNTVRLIRVRTKKEIIEKNTPIMK